MSTEPEKLTRRRRSLAAARRGADAMPRLNPIERRMSKFMQQPPSVRMAASVIVTATMVVVAVAGLLMRIFDHQEYPDIWRGMWWALQTVTTVGYGDVTPQRLAGRLIAVFVMLEGIAFLAILTAAITSSFVARAERELREHADAKADLSGRFDELDGRLDRLEAMLRDIANPS